MENDRKLILNMGNGEEVEAEILFTYYSEEFQKNYVVFVPNGSEEAGAAVYIEESETNGRLEAVETDAEWQLLEELLKEYMESEDTEDGE